MIIKWTAPHGVEMINSVTGTVSYNPEQKTVSFKVDDETARVIHSGLVKVLSHSGALIAEYPLSPLDVDK